MARLGKAFGSGSSPRAFSIWYSLRTCWFPKYAALSSAAIPTSWFTTWRAFRGLWDPVAALYSWLKSMAICVSMAFPLVWRGALGFLMTVFGSPGFWIFAAKGSSWGFPCAFWESCGVNVMLRFWDSSSVLFMLIPTACAFWAFFFAASLSAFS